MFLNTFNVFITHFSINKYDENYVKVYQQPGGCGQSVLEDSEVLLLTEAIIVRSSRIALRAVY